MIAPDLPGHGASEVADGPLDADRVLAWLGELIERTCPSPPALVGQVLGGAIAARFAIDRGDRLSRLVLVDTLGLGAFQPAPEFGAGPAPTSSRSRPRPRTTALWRQCAFDLDGLRERMGERWEPFEAYNLDRARAPSVQAALAALMEQFGVPPIPPAELAADRRPDDPDLGAARPRDAARGRRGRERPLRLAAARDRGLRRRPPRRAARGVLRGAGRGREARMTERLETA